MKKYEVVTQDSFNVFGYGDSNIRQICLGSDDVWFVGKDIAEVLGFRNFKKAIENNVDEEDKKFINLKSEVNQKGRLPKVALINESGMYSLILKSTLSTAKEFKKWVTSEVLPAIRKTGRYGMPAKKVPDLDDFDFGGFSVPTTRTEALALAVELSGKIEELETELKEMQPIKEWADSATTIDQDVPIDVAAKLLNQAGYDIGSVRLLNILRSHHILCTERNNWNRPRQVYIDNGLFKIKWRYVSEKFGNAYTPYVSTKGIEWLFKKFASGDFQENDVQKEMPLPAPVSEPLLLN